MNNQKLEDFEVLKDLMQLKVKLNEIDDDTKKRLIELCREQIEITNKKIDEVRKKNEELRVKIEQIKKGKKNV